MGEGASGGARAGDDGKFRVRLKADGSQLQVHREMPDCSSNELHRGKWRASTSGFRHFYPLHSSD